MANTLPKDYMTLALELARRGRYTVSPNPMVGCILVKDQQVIGQGFHQRAGEPHAEVMALRDCGAAAFGATAYVTLEPCCHFGRTPPCTQALIDAGVKTVYFACLDPNPLVAGKGMQALQAAGVEVKAGLCEAEARQLNEFFFHYIQTRRPFVLAKWAMSLDGRMTTQPQDSRQISSLESQQHTHELRRQVDAILIGAQTALQDDPQLTVRTLQDGASPLKQPLRIVLSSKGKLPLDLKLFSGVLPGKTLVAATTAADPHWCSALAEKQIEVLRFPPNAAGEVDLAALLDLLGQRAVTSLLVEGGPAVHARFFGQRLVNKLQVYLAPAVIASLPKKQFYTQIECQRFGHDFAFSVHL